MILSVSRRTDIPNYYTDWFYKRLEEGYVYVRNPHQANMLWQVQLSPDVVDCIVFWSKNPEPMLAGLSKLAEYAYYYQFTLTGYGEDIEPGLPDKGHMAEVFLRLSDAVGPQRVVWRYDPILYTRKYTADWHLMTFAKMAERLKGHTKRVVISFMDFYTGRTQNVQKAGIYLAAQQDMNKLAGKLAAIAAECGMEMVTCSELADLQEYGIRHGACIDKELVELAAGCSMDIGKDKYQRMECGCCESIDIGAYDTCRNGCVYCYARRSDERTARQVGQYRLDSPLLCSEARVEDKIAERRVKSQKNMQMSLFTLGGFS